MKALVKFASGAGQVELRDMPEPAPADNQVKIEIAACGICGTDLHVYHDTFRNYPPVILGHEFAGRVVEIGKNVKGVREEERFTILGASTVTCGRCVYCRKGEFMFCPERRGMGHGVNGAFTRYAVARPDQLFRLPDDLPSEEGALCEPFAAAVHAVCEITPMQFGDVVLVSGPGPIGLLCLKLLVAQGLKVIVAGTAQDARRLALAKQFGAARIVDVPREDLQQIVKDETDGFGVDVAFECAGAAASARAALASVRPLGRYTQVGHFGKSIELNFDLLAFRQIRMKGSVGYTAETWKRMMNILGQGRVKLGEIITHRLSLDDWKQGFDACEDKSALKVLLKP
ncbi:MAG: alcohol dehydrogenase catalytic domain-containing protein [Verrucomicrobiales bacterium]|nr:alcohol dehydrogenase catalytic domain-containing protein [Verrucomicrobiales bacterium]